MSLVALQRNGGEAIYSQISKLLKQEIASFMLAGECLPSEQALAERFGVNRHTIRRAIDDLVHAGIVERRHGIGTFILDSPTDYLLGKGTRFTEAFEATGRTASNRIVKKLIIPARGGVANRLLLEEKAQVVWIESLRFADDKPICVISHFLPLTVFPDLFDEYQGGSLHEHLFQRYGFRLQRIESIISAQLPQGDDARLLSMAQNNPVLRVKSVNVCESDGVPMEYALTRFRADRIQLRINP
ncbi:MAG: phosphonate metabolism transcriptional regulator PhnF [Candidatus Thiodiazotropha sp.]|jgi:GntR family transcriptional regulator, phosphonate transport system regulatory protein